MKSCWAAAALVLSGTLPIFGQADVSDLTKLSVDELFNLKVTSVGKRAQQLSKSPAAVFVITQEDIRRSGATSIPEVLQLAPGLTVIPIDGRDWAISARGFAAEFANKMLVMVDGRSAYSPFFSGTFWDSLGVMLEDIERIEVIRGPGATVWGPNAVNGVINIITKRSRSTVGTLVKVTSGPEVPGSAAVRWGSAPSGETSYRIWGSAEDQIPQYRNTNGSWDSIPTRNEFLGFRFDHEQPSGQELMVEGQLFNVDRGAAIGNGNFAVDGPRSLTGVSFERGGYLTGKWVQTNAGSENMLQVSAEQGWLNYQIAGGTFDKLDVDFQHRRTLSESNELYLGIGHEQYWDNVWTHSGVTVNPSDGGAQTSYVTLRDEIQLIPQQLHFSAGGRLDYNNYTRFEFQPNLSLLYTPTPRQSAWISLSRAVRVPNRWDRDLAVQLYTGSSAGLPTYIENAGSTAFLSEVLRSIDAGYRYQPSSRWSIDLAVFRSWYSRLKSHQTDLTPNFTEVAGVPSLVLSDQLGNLGSADSYGGELAGTFQVREGWRLLPSYSYLQLNEHYPLLPGFLVSGSGDYVNPKHQGVIRSQHDFGRHWQVDLTVRGRSKPIPQPLPGVVLVDARLAWRPSRKGELSFVVGNLTGRETIEMLATSAYPSVTSHRTFRVQWTQSFR